MSKVSNSYYRANWESSSHDAANYGLDEDGEEVFAPGSQDYYYAESSQESIHSYDDFAFQEY